MVLVRYKLSHFSLLTGKAQSQNDVNVNKYLIHDVDNKRYKVSPDKFTVISSNTAWRVKNACSKHSIGEVLTIFSNIGHLINTAI